MVRRRLSILLAVLLAAAGLLAAPGAAYAELAASPKATVSFNGAVRSVVYAGSTIYVGGDFTYAYYGNKRWPRNHMAAVNASTGQLTGFAPNLDGAVHALAVDGSSVYAGGYFLNVDGQHRRHIARFTSGSLDTWRHSLSGVPRALTVDGGRLYAGGSFGVADGVARANLAAWDGDTLTDFAPVLDGTVRSLTADTGRLYVSGTFNTVNGTGQRKLAALDKESGALVTGFAPKVSVIVYDVLLAQGRVYAALGGQGGQLVAYDGYGNVRWTTTTDGDVTSLAAIGSTVYVGGHFESVCSTTRTGDQGACLDGQRAARYKFLAVTSLGGLTAWDPWADSTIGVWSLASNGRDLAAGGTFLTFGQGAVKQRGFAEFNG